MKKSAVLIIVILLISAATILSSSVFIIMADIKGEKTAEEKKVKENKDKAFEEIFVYVPEKSIIANVKDSKKFVRFNYAMELGKLQDFTALKKNEQMITDLVIEIIRGTDEEAFKQENAQDMLKEKIKEQVSAQITLEALVSVYVTELVIQ